MDRDDKIKGLLILVFFGVLIGGAVITFNNFHSWNNVRVSVVNEYHNPESKQTTEAGNQDKNQNPEDDPDNTNSDSNNDKTGNPENDQDSNIDNQNTQNQNNTADPDNNDDNNGTSDDNSDQGENPGNTDNSDEINGEQSDSRDPEDNENNREENSESDDSKMQEKVTYKEGFYISEITDEIFDRIKGKSFPDSCTVSRNDLRYVHVRHYGFEGEVREGELIVNAAIAQDVIEIFQELYDIKYQIEKIRLIDEYDADDERSMEANNSSCFNYRTIAESSTLSNHAYGRAIDINPFYNPYVYERSDGSLFLQPKGSEKYVDRTVDAACIIQHGDACYNIFAKHGFSWGGDWKSKKDYQHFEKTN